MTPYSFNIALENNCCKINGGSEMMCATMPYLQEKCRELDVTKKEYISAQIGCCTGYRCSSEHTLDRWSGNLCIDLDDHKNELGVKWQEMQDLLDEAGIPGLHYTQISKSGHGLHLLFRCRSNETKDFAAYFDKCTENVKHWMLSTEWRLLADQPGFFDSHMKNIMQMCNFSGYPIVPVDNAVDAVLDDCCCVSGCSDPGVTAKGKNKALLNRYTNLAKKVKNGQSIEDGMFDYVQVNGLYNSLSLFGYNREILSRNAPRKCGKKWNIKMNKCRKEEIDCFKSVERHLSNEKSFKHKAKHCYIIGTGCGKTHYMSEWLITHKKVLYATYRKALVEDAYDNALKLSDAAKENGKMDKVQMFNIEKGASLKEALEYGANIFTTIQSLEKLDDEYLEYIKDYEIFIDEVHLFEEFTNTRMTSKLLLMDKTTCFTASATDLCCCYMEHFGYKIEKLELNNLFKQKAELLFFNTGNPVKANGDTNPYYKHNVEKNIIKITEYLQQKKIRPLIYVNDKNIIDSIEKHFGENECISYYTLCDEKNDPRISLIKNTRKIVCCTSKLGVGVSFHGVFDAVIAVTEDPFELQQICARERDNNLFIFALVPCQYNTKYILNSDYLCINYLHSYFGEKAPTPNIMNRQWRQMWKNVRKHWLRMNTDLTCMSMRNLLKETFEVNVHNCCGIFTAFCSLDKLDNEVHTSNIRWKAIFEEWKKRIETGDIIDNYEMSSVERDYVNAAYEKWRDNRETEWQQWNTKDFKNWLLGEKEDEDIEQWITWVRKNGKKCFFLKDVEESISKALEDKEVMAAKKDIITAMIQIRYKYDKELGAYVSKRDSVGKAKGLNNQKQKAKEMEMRQKFEEYKGGRLATDDITLYRYAKRKGWIS